MFIGKTERARLTAKLIEVRRKIDVLQIERRALNMNAAGAEGDRHTFIGAKLQILRVAERELNAPLLDAMENSIRKKPK
jgi:hypothetical protein